MNKLRKIHRNKSIINVRSKVPSHFVLLVLKRFLSPHSYSFFIFFLARFVDAVSVVSISLVCDSSIVATSLPIPAACFAFCLCFIRFVFVVCSCFVW